MDALNRVTQKSYSDGTPTVNYAYDAAGAGYDWNRFDGRCNDARGE